MAKFMTDLCAVKANGTWKLTQPLIYHSDLVKWVSVPIGFKTDFASVPRIPVIYALVGDRAHYPAVIHDYLYSVDAKPNVSRKEADLVFLEAMEARGIGWLYRKMMYWGVRMGGGSYYKKETK